MCAGGAALSAISTSSKGVASHARGWWALAIATLPVALWWLLGLTPAASPIAYLISTIPVVVAIRALISKLDADSILPSVVGGFVVAVSVLGATGNGMMFMPFGIVALVLELSDLHGLTRSSTGVRMAGLALGMSLGFLVAFALGGWFR